jgi:hypothetical protein
MKIEANGLRRGVIFVFETILSKTTTGDVLNISRNG